MSAVTINMVDNSGEPTSVQFYLPQLTSANYDDVAGNVAGQNVGDLRLAIAAITLANFTNHSVSAVNYPESGDLPANPYAQREIGLMVKYVDTVNAKKAHRVIPAPDLTLIAQTGTDVVDHTSNVAAVALTAAIEANAVSQDGNPVVVTGMRIVGRKN